MPLILTYFRSSSLDLPSLVWKDLIEWKTSSDEQDRLTTELFEKIYQGESRKVHATLVRLLQDFDLAEEASQEAFAAALKQWPETGVPEKPGPWLISTGRFKAIDIIRRRSKFRELEPELVFQLNELQASQAELSELDVPDDQLRLIFTCCHPAIDLAVQVPLTLREVCGLSTNEVAKAFLTTSIAMAQRIVRGKNKIRLAKIPFVIPEAADLPNRLNAVLRVVYLIFNQAYSSPRSREETDRNLAEEAIRLGRLLLELLPDIEVKGLLALMLLHQSRHPGRFNEEGEIILLRDQDRARWNRDYIAEGVELLQQALSTGEVGTYGLQAAISAVHAQAASHEQTDWTEIVNLYNFLLTIEANPVIELNRAAALAMRDGPEAGLNLVDEILNRGQLSDYPLAHVARGEFLEQLGKSPEAIVSLEKALSLTETQAEQEFLERKIKTLKSVDPEHC